MAQCIYVISCSTKYMAQMFSQSRKAWQADCLWTWWGEHTIIKIRKVLVWGRWSWQGFFSKKKLYHITIFNGIGLRVDRNHLLQPAYSNRPIRSPSDRKSHNDRSAHSWLSIRWADPNAAGWPGKQRQPVALQCRNNRYDSAVGSLHVPGPTPAAHGQTRSRLWTISNGQTYYSYVGWMVGEKRETSGWYQSLDLYVQFWRKSKGYVLHPWDLLQQTSIRDGTYNVGVSSPTIQLMLH